MTIDEAIHLADELTPNTIMRTRKLEWLSRLDQRIFKEIMNGHVDKEAPAEMPAYDMDTDPDTQLLAGAPHDEMYRFYLEMQYHLANMELDKYNNAAVLYANAWQTFAREYHRDHKPDTASGCLYHHF